MKRIITLSLVCLSIFVQAQLAMSFTGSYNLGQGDLKDHYKNGMGIHTAIYYQFEESPWATSLNFGCQIFEAEDDFVATYKAMQQNILEFDYEIRSYAIPITLNAHYRFFKEHKLQVDLGMGAGLNVYVTNIKQVGDYFSDDIQEEKAQFMISPQLSIIYELCDDIAVILHGGYNHTFAEDKIHHFNTNLGILYQL